MPQQDAIRFFYFSKMNLALKISNLQARDVLTLELKLILNQIHGQFESDPDCLEIQLNNAYYWVVGVNSLGREIYLVFPPNYTSSKVD